MIMWSMAGTGAGLKVLNRSWRTPGIWAIRTKNLQEVRISEDSIMRSIIPGQNVVETLPDRTLKEVAAPWAQ